MRLRNLAKKIAACCLAATVGVTTISFGHIGLNQVAAGELSAKEWESSTQIDNIYVSKYGNLYINITKEEFLESGYEYGDIVKVQVFDNVYELPFGSNYSDVDAGEALLIARASDNYINLGINGGDFATSRGIAVKTIKDDGKYEWTPCEGYEGTIPVRISMKEKAGYKDEYDIRNMTYSNDRNDYADLSDEEFANFRNIHTTGIAENILYRTSSPISDVNGRNTYADAALKKAGVTVVINLTDSADKVGQYADFDNTYYSTTNYIALDMGIDFSSEENKTKLATGLRFMAENKGIYAIHCSHGKDRAGLMSALIEGFMGASYEEMEKDYLISFYNYYGVKEGDARYDALKRQFKSLLNTTLGVADITEVNLKEQVTEYFKSTGLSVSELEMLENNIAPTIVAPEYIDYTSKVIAKGGSIIIKAFSGAENVSYSKNGKITIDTKSGKITARETGTVTATVKMSDSLYYVIKIKVVVPSFDKATIYPNKGKSVKLKFDLKGITGKTKYKSSNKKIVTVDNNGKLKALKCGKAKITVTVQGKTYSITVKVCNPAISGKSTAKKGSTIKLTIKNGHGKTKWTSSNPKKATIDSKGKLKAKRTGKVVITAKNNGITIKKTIRIKAK